MYLKPALKVGMNGQILGVLRFHREFAITDFSYLCFWSVDVFPYHMGKSVP